MSGIVAGLEIRSVIEIENLGENHTQSPSIFHYFFIFLENFLVLETGVEFHLCIIYTKAKYNSSLQLVTRHI